MAVARVNDYVAILWLAFYAYWAYSIFYEKATKRSKAVERAEPLARATASRLALWAAALFSLVSFPQQNYPFNISFMPASLPAPWLGFEVGLVGVLFEVWARRALGGNWNADPALKKGQTLTTEGPYSIVRHPIYSGIALLVIGSAIVQNSITGLCGIVFILVFAYIRIREEDRLMAEKFGKDYDKYRASVKAFIPYLV